MKFKQNYLPFGDDYKPFPNIHTKTRPVEYTSPPLTPFATWIADSVQHNVNPEPLANMTFLANKSNIPGAILYTPNHFCGVWDLKDCASFGNSFDRSLRYEDVIIQVASAIQGFCLSLNHLLAWGKLPATSINNSHHMYLGSGYLSPTSRRTELCFLEAIRMALDYRSIIDLFPHVVWQNRHFVTSQNPPYHFLRFEIPESSLPSLLDKWAFARNIKMRSQMRPINWRLRKDEAHLSSPASR